MKKNKNILTVILALALSAALLVGCSPAELAAEHPEASHSLAEAAFGGVLCLKINPEIAVHYDENGKVTKLEGRNPDGAQILENFTGYEGKETSQVLEELVEAIGKAGYLVEEAEGKSRRIVLELDPGSQVPHEKFLEDMAAHVEKCVKNKEWVGEAEFEYDEGKAEAAPGATESAKPVEGESVNIPQNLCPVCGDDDCDDGKYCDDADELAENLREAENRKNGIRCEICGDYDCDDGVYCDDADEKAENLREEQPKPTEPQPTTPKVTEPALCPVCGDDDCDDGEYCDDADELAENLREAENKKNGIRCQICGDYDCDDGVYCDDADEKAENLREEQHKATEPKPTTPKVTEPALCPVCGDDDCDDGEYCDDADELAENLREAENRKNGITCPVCGDDDCDDGEDCDDWDDDDD